MNGTSATTFSPNTPMTRAMLVTVLHRAAGSPSAATGTAFSDVPSGAYYTDAVAWASANSIVTGYGNGRFGPDDPVTREQTAAILYRYAAWYDLAGDGEAPLSGYPDAGTVSSWARSAMGWAVGAGYLTGSAEDGAVLLRPQALAVRLYDDEFLFLRFDKYRVFHIIPPVVWVLPAPVLRLFCW